MNRGVSMKKENKIIVLITLIAILGCLLYVPWKSTRSYENKNIISYDVGYSFIFSRPQIYVEGDFKPPSNKMKSTDSIKGAFSDIANEIKASKRKEELKAQGYTIYPDWVKTSIELNYVQIGFNIVIVILSSFIVSTLLNLIKSKQR